MSESLITDEARAMLGSEMPVSRETVEAGAVRRWARAVLLPDREWSRGDAVPTTFCMSLAKGFMGRRAAEATFSEEEASIYWLVPLRSSRTFNGGDVFTVHEPLRVGDEVVRRSRLEDITERRTSDGRRRAFVTSRTTYSVDGDVRVTWDNYTITVPEDEPPTAGSGEPGGPAQTRAPVVDAVEDAQPDQRLPVLEETIGTIEICRFAGVNEEFALQHVDKDFARERLGLPTVNIMGWLKGGLAATALDRWAGFGRVEELRTRYEGLDLGDDTLRVEGAVTGVDDGAVDVELGIWNQRGERNTRAWATIGPPDQTPDRQV